MKASRFPAVESPGGHFAVADINVDHVPLFFHRYASSLSFGILSRLEAANLWSCGGLSARALAAALLPIGWRSFFQIQDQRQNSA
jgi:hypothetical protein